MPIVHPVVGVRVMGLFIAHLFNQPGERRAGYVTYVDLAEFVSGLPCFFNFRL